MPIRITWLEIGIRLLCTLVAAGVIGLNRSEHGRAAGLRTSILVSLAACIAMLQVNLLLPLAGRASDSFVMNDLMRLPLGILSGMGFIGAGAIVRRHGNLVVRLTTAATLWFLTVIGLCIGGGQIGLGLAGAALGIFVLSGLKFVEHRLTRERRGSLSIVTTLAGPAENEIRIALENQGFGILSCAFGSTGGTQTQELRCDLHWRAKPEETSVPEIVRLLAARDGVTRVDWTPQAD